MLLCAALRGHHDVAVAILAVDKHGLARLSRSPPERSQREGRRPTPKVAVLAIGGEIPLHVLRHPAGRILQGLLIKGHSVLPHFSCPMRYGQAGRLSRRRCRRVRRASHHNFVYTTQSEGSVPNDLPPEVIQVLTLGLAGRLARLPQELAPDVVHSVAGKVRDAVRAED